MPVSMKTITSTKKGSEGEKVEIRDYWFKSSMEPIAVAYGCFSPFTGKYGHARLLENAKEHGISKFIICSPNKKQVVDNDRNMFTLEQKVEIADKGAKSLGYNVIDSFIASSNFVVSNLLEIAEKYPENRIVLCCGPDRIAEYGRYMNKFEAGRNQLPDDSDPKPGKFEFLTLEDRGEKNVSGTAIRAMIRNGDREGFLEMTGYSPKMWDLVYGMAKNNGVLEERFSDFFADTQLDEALAATNRVGIKHLYNPGNAQELGALEFFDLLDLLEEDGGKLVNGKNFSMTEKSDGAAFRMGVDDEGKFFVEQSYSGPIYDSDFIRDKYSKKFGRVNRLARGWANIIDILQADEKTQACMSKIFDDIGPFKISGEIFISELGMKDENGYVTFVGSRYDPKRLGEDATIVLFAVNDADGESVPDTQKIIKYLIKNGSSKSIKYDDAELNVKQNIAINVGTEIKKIRANVDRFEKENELSIPEVLNNPSRKKSDIQLKKFVRTFVEEQQGVLNAKFESQLEHYEGKWGPDYEGVVIKLKDGTMIKITSKGFKEFKAKHDDSLQKWIMENKSFVSEFERYIR